jgi:glycerol-3-phosphate acyltransferase PlsX
VARIALDAMGGDLGPAEAVAGAIDAAAGGVDVVLVGDEAQIAAQLALTGSSLPIVHAPEVVHMGEDPARAIREKPGSSVATCARMVRDGSADGFVSAGSTGAAMASAAIIIGRLERVMRPTIASVFPTDGSPTVVLDSGANPEVKPEHIVQFAEMGAALSETYFDVTNPRVGLLNIGEEKGKGRVLDKEAYALLEAAPVNFIGNVEGRDVATDRADVIVTDGFTGNVFLKTTEGAASLTARLILAALDAAPGDVRSEVLPLLDPIRRRMDYEETGGAHLLGTRGVVVIAHGSSTRRAIANALRMASDGANRGLVARVADRIGR